MERLMRDSLHFYFDRMIPPALKISSGERVEIETEDAIAGQLTPETVDRLTHAEMRANIPCSNPVTGPIYIEGAAPGDAIAVTIEAIEVAPAEKYAWTIFDSYEGLLTQATATLNRPLRETNRILPISGDALHFEFKNKTIPVPIQPAVGTIGVAPVGERRYSYLNGNDFLGNVDIPALGAGKTVILPVHVAGALLSLGDVHAVSGQGEISGGAADCRGIVRIRIELLKRAQLKYFNLPQLNSDVFIGSIAAAGSLDQAVKQAYRDLILRMQQHGFEIIEAYQLLSSVGEVQIGQMIPPLFQSALAFVKRQYVE